jgi:hypothetical protein
MDEAFGGVDKLSLDPSRWCPEPGCQSTPVPVPEVVAEIGLSGGTIRVYFCNNGHGPFGINGVDQWFPLDDDTVRDARVTDNPSN